MTTDSHRRKQKHHHHRQLDTIQYDPASYILRRFLESIFFFQFLNRQQHGKKESTVAVFRPGGRPSQAISTAKEKEERRSVSGGLHETFKAKREKNNKRTKKEQTHKQTRIPSTQTMRSQKMRKIVKRRRTTTTTTRLHKKASNKKTEKELARKIQTKRRQRSCKDGLRKKTYYNSFIKTNNKTSTTTTRRRRRHQQISSIDRQTAGKRNTNDKSNKLKVDTKIGTRIFHGGRK